MELDFSDVKPSPISFLIVGLMAVLFITLFKMAMARFPLPGLNEVAQGL